MATIGVRAGMENQGTTSGIHLMEPETIREIRIVFDSDLDRETLPQDGLNRNMGSTYLLATEADAYA